MQILGGNSDGSLWLSVWLCLKKKKKTCRRCYLVMASPPCAHPWGLRCQLRISVRMPSDGSAVQVQTEIVSLISLLPVMVVIVSVRGASIRITVSILLCWAQHRSTLLMLQGCGPFVSSWAPVCIRSFWGLWKCSSCFCRSAVGDSKGSCWLPALVTRAQFRRRTLPWLPFPTSCPSAAADCLLVRVLSVGEGFHCAPVLSQSFWLASSSSPEHTHLHVYTDVHTHIHSQTNPFTHSQILPYTHMDTCPSTPQHAHIDTNTHT